MREFRNQAVQELTDQQVRFAPLTRRLEQMARAERLLGEVEPARLYPYQFVCFRITDFRSDAYPDLLIGGADLKHDLDLVLDRLARSVQSAPPDLAAGPVLSLDEVSKRLNVSTKTVLRWRKHGLVGRKIVANGRVQLGFPEAAVAEFIAAHPETAARGSRFSHLSETERDDIIVRARRLADVGACLTEASRRIANKLGRSVEAVRYTIKNFDRDHPRRALFPGNAGSLADEAKLLIFNSYRRGMTVELLAKQFGRTRASVYRVINEVKAERLLNQPLDYIYHASFDDPAQESEITAPMPDDDSFIEAKRKMRAPKDVPVEFVPLYETPLLNKPQEQHVFRQMNFLKHKLHLLREKMKADPARAKAADFQQVETLTRQVEAIKELLINCNMRLVMSIAKKHANVADNLFELLSDGNMSLIRAVEKFDYSRGNKFSTYASWAIMKNFARSIPGEKTHRERYLTGHDEVFASRPDNRTDEHEIVAAAEQATYKVNELLEKLDPRERDIIRLRAGLDGAEGMTLEQIGQQKGITKERVRQLHVRAMKKLRDWAYQGQPE